jgi:hypothetical protein
LNDPLFATRIFRLLKVLKELFHLSMVLLEHLENRIGFSQQSHTPSYLMMFCKRKSQLFTTYDKQTGERP